MGIALFGKGFKIFERSFKVPLICCIHSFKKVWV